ncbi:MAG: hypothetical protein IJB63_05145 [Alistipes sp.]|nr:hypothetical protein [Alistipes sp.]
MCSVLQFVGCDKNKDFDDEANIIRLSDENLTRRFLNGDDVAFYYQCQFATDVEFQIMPKNSSTVLYTETASITPGDGKLTLRGEYNQVWDVSGYNNTYIVLDEVTSNGENLRTILKRGVL